MKHLLIKTTIRFIYNSNIENIIFFNLKNKNLISILLIINHIIKFITFDVTLLKFFIFRRSFFPKKGI